MSDRGRSFNSIPQAPSSAAGVSGFLFHCVLYRGFYISIFYAGPSVFAGLGVMILLIPVNGIIATRARKLQISQMELKDERVKVMNEVSFFYTCMLLQLYVQNCISNININLLRSFTLATKAIYEKQ